MMKGLINQMQSEMDRMKGELKDLKEENKTLKDQKVSNPGKHKQDDGMGGRGNQGKGGEEGQKDHDPWKDWKKQEEAPKVDDGWEKGGGAWKEKVEAGTYGREDWGKRVWRGGGGNDRSNEMVARGFKRNTYWNEIKLRVEEVMGLSRVMNNGVKVIGEMASFAIIRFDKYENKHEFKRWLGTHGEEVKEHRGIWFGDNIDKDARARERAVGKVKRALIMAREGRKDVYRDFRRGTVYVGDDMVAKWDWVSKVMTFQGEGKQVRESFKKLMAEGKREDEDFSE